MYYKSILQILKDPSSNENTRLKIIDETINDDKHICHLYLQPDDKCKCPICNSNETTLFGSTITKSPKTVKKYLGLTLLPHSGVSLVFTGIAVNILTNSAPD